MSPHCGKPHENIVTKLKKSIIAKVFLLRHVMNILRFIQGTFKTLHPVPPRPADTCLYEILLVEREKDVHLTSAGKHGLDKENVRTAGSGTKAVGTIEFIQSRLDFHLCQCLGFRGKPNGPTLFINNVTGASDYSRLRKNTCNFFQDHGVFIGGGNLDCLRSGGRNFGRFGIRHGHRFRIGFQGCIELSFD